MHGNVAVSCVDSAHSPALTGCSIVILYLLVLIVLRNVNDQDPVVQIAERNTWKGTPELKGRKTKRQLHHGHSQMEMGARWGPGGRGDSLYRNPVLFRQEQRR